MAGGERTWAFMKEMGQVMKHFRGPNVNKLKSRASPEFLCKLFFLWDFPVFARIINILYNMIIQFILSIYLFPTVHIPPKQGGQSRSQAWTFPALLNRLFPLPLIHLPFPLHKRTVTAFIHSSGTTFLDATFRIYHNHFNICLPLEFSISQSHPLLVLFLL